MKKFIEILTVLMTVLLNISCEYISDLEMETGLTDGLVAYWPMNEQVDPSDSAGSTIHDYAGKHNLTLEYDGEIGGDEPSAISVDGKYGRALYFDGQDDFADCFSNNILNGSNFFTVAFWIKDPYNNDAPIVDSGGFYFINSGSAAYLLFRLKPLDPNSYTEYNSTWSASGKWTYVTGTYDGQTICLYIDGICVITQSYSGKIAQSDVLTIGKEYGGSQHINATLDEVRIYNRALSEDEIKKLMTVGVK